MIFDLVKGVLEFGRDERKARVKEIVVSESISCRKCGGLCVPLYDSYNKYRCVKCQNQFANAKHNIGKRIRNEFGSDKKILYKEVVDEMSES